ncbi:sulfatase-like hydrolase/transferase [Comamonadaceae bacterium M7527]|nr:sulfatase-like hydrolase/transferase [Comamonadaceae bacterium M7527]
MKQLPTNLPITSCSLFTTTTDQPHALSRVKSVAEKFLRCQCNEQKNFGTCFDPCNCSIYFPIYFLYRLTKWILTTFGGVTSDQLVFHLLAKTAGTPTAISNKLILEVGLKPLLAIFIFYIVIWIFRKFSKLIKIFKFSTLGVCIALLVVTLHKNYDMLYKLDVSNEFAANYSATDIFKEHYVPPVVLKDPKDNLIWIYFESLEKKYVGADANFRVTEKSFDGHFISLDGTGWTFSGIMASQCGVPYLTNPVASRGPFLQGAVCLSDLLKKSGYAINFLGGAPLHFSNKGDFLKAHGFDRAVGRDELESILNFAPPPQDEYWGYRDEDLFKVFENDVINLHKAGRPFYYVALTLDTHGPLVQSQDCVKYPYDTSEAGVFKCGIARINTLIDSLESAGVLENTTVVVSGDHPKMRGYNFAWTDSFTSKKSERGPVYFYVRPADRGVITSRSEIGEIHNHFDLFPAVFNSIGGELEQGSAGLGRSSPAVTSLSLEFSENEFNYLLRRPSEAYEALWPN